MKCCESFTTWLLTTNRCKGLCGHESTILASLLMKVSMRKSCNEPQATTKVTHKSHQICLICFFLSLIFFLLKTKNNLSTLKSNQKWNADVHSFYVQNFVCFVPFTSVWLIFRKLDFRHNCWTRWTLTVEPYVTMSGVQPKVNL